MKKEFIVYAVLLCISLAAAFYASQPRKLSDARSVAWVSIAPDLVQEVRWESAKSRVRAFRKGGGSGRFWLSVSKLEGQQVETEIPHFLASKDFEYFMESLYPFEVLRVIADAQEDLLEEYGFGANSPTLNVRYGSQNRDFALKVGNKQYNTSNVFVLDVEQNKLLLIRSTHIDKFDKAESRLFQRELLAKQWPDFDEIALKSPTLGQLFLQRIPAKEENASGWVISGKDMKPRASYQSWFNKIDRLRATEYADETRQAELGENEFFLEMHFSGKGGAQETLRFYSVTTEAPDGELEYWIWSSSFDAYAKVASHRMDTIQKDIPNIFAEN